MQRILLGAVLLVAGAAPARGQPPAGLITGRVVHAVTRTPIEAATIEVVGTGRLTRSLADGRFRLDAVPVGEHLVRVVAIGFEPMLLAEILVGAGRPVVLAPALAPRPLVLEEIGVQAEPFFQPGVPGAPGAVTLVREETRRAPGVQEDVLRAVALLPGVGVTSGGRNDLLVRGGAPFENLFVVDGIEVPNLNHFGSQGSTGGPLTLLDAEFVQEASFSAGGFGARHGDRTSSLTRITLREGNQARTAGGVTLSATGVGASFEGPAGRDGSWFLGVRRSYLDLIFRAAGFSSIPAYWDLQGKLTRRLDARNSLSALVIGALDDLAFNNSTAENRYDNRRIPSLEQRLYLAGLTWQRAADAGVMTVTLGRTFTRFRTVQNDTLVPPTPVFQNASREGETSLRVEWTRVLGAGSSLTVGSVARLAGDLDYDLRLPGDLRRDDQGLARPLAQDTSFRAFRQAAYAEATLEAGAWRVVPGARLDYYGFLDDAVRTAPRLRVEWEAGAGTAVTASGGRYWQAPAYIWLAGDASNAGLEPLRADVVVLGVRRELRPDLRVQLEVYAKRYADYPARVFRPQAVLAPSGFEDVTTDIPFGLEPLASAGRGHAEGLEFLVQKRTGITPWYGLASVSVGRSRFTGLDGVERPGSYDTRLIATVLAGWRPNSRWEVSGKVRVATGRPTTPFLVAGPDAGSPDFTRYHAGPRLPVFHAADLRVDRRWSFRRSQLVAYVDIQNVYGRANVNEFEWDARSATVQPNRSLGVFPTIGLTLGF